MDTEVDLFVQAFWVKCRETIRPEFDAAIETLRAAGHSPSVRRDRARRRRSISAAMS